MHSPRPLPRRSPAWRPLLASAAALGAALVGPASGCTVDPAPMAARGTQGPVAVGDRLVFADLGRDELVAVTVAQGDVTADRARRVALDGAPDKLLALPSSDTVLALSTDAETLDAVDLVAPADEALRSWPLGAPFSGLVVSPDGDAALAYYAPGTRSTVFANDNEVALVELGASASEDLAAAVTRRTLASLGGSLTGIAVSPKVAGARYAFVLSRDHVAIVNLLTPSAPERSVPLVSLDGGAQRTPLAVTFGADPDGETLWGIVTTQEGSSAYALQVNANASTDAGFDVRLTQLAGVSAGGDVALITLEDGRYVALLANPLAHTATLTQLSNGTSRTLSLGTPAGRIRTYTEDGRPMALLFGGSDAFHILDVGQVEAKKDKALRTRFGASTINEVYPVPGTPLFVATHSQGDAGLSIIHADTDRVTAFGSTGTVRDLHISPDLGRVYLRTTVSGQQYVVSIDLESLHPDAAEAPRNENNALVVVEGGQTVALYTPTDGGLLTLWPAAGTTDEDTLAYPGFLLDGLLNHAAEEN